MDGIYLSTVVSAEEKHTKFQGLPQFDKRRSYQTDNVCGAVAKKGREPFHPWIPSAKEVAALDGAVALPCQGDFPVHKRRKMLPD
jgi:ubiquitin carboxyl-terminal hydrolase 22/27/51